MISLTFIVACLNITLALIMLFANWKLNKNVVFFSVYLIIISFVSLLYDTIINGGSAHFLMLLIGNSGPLLVLTGPMFYFFVRGLVREDYEFSDKDLLHFVPFFINMIILVPYIFSPIDFKLMIAENSLGNLSFYMNSYIIMFPTWVCNLVKVLIIITYIIFSMMILRRGLVKRLLTLDEIARKQYLKTYRWLNFYSVFSIVLSIMHLGLISYFRFNAYEYLNLQNQAFFALSSIANTILPITLLFNPSILLGMPTVKVLAPEEKAKLWHENVVYQQTDLGLTDDNTAHTTYFRELSDRIMLYIKNTKPYLDSNFRVNDLADIFGVPLLHIHYCFKTYIAKKFEAVTDEYRINHALKLIKDIGSDDISDFSNIRIESGFKNQAGFNKAFKSITGKTPAQWIKAKT